MEAIKAIAKKTKSGKYKIDLPIAVNADEIEGIIVYNNPKIITNNKAGILQKK